MNIYLIIQKEVSGYDTYDSAVVCAESEEEAKKIHPRGIRYNAMEDGLFMDTIGEWASHVDYVNAELIGKADAKFTESCLLLASYNAG